MAPGFKDPTTSELGIKSTAMPLDIQQQQLKLARKQRLYDTMTEQVMQNRGKTEMAGNVAIQKSPFEALAQVLAAGAIRYGEGKLEKESEKLGTDYENLRVSEMDNFNQLMNGGKELSPAVPGSAPVYAPQEDFTEGVEMPDPQLITPGTEAKPAVYSQPDTKAALAALLSAKHPAVRDLGNMLQKEEMKRQYMMQEQAMGGLTNEGKLKAGLTGQLPTGPGAVKAEPIDEKAGVLFQNGAPMAPLPASARFIVGYDANGNMIQEQPQTGKMDGVNKAPTIKNSTSVSVAGPNEGAKALWGGVEKELTDARGRLQGGKDLLGTLGELEQLTKNGLYGGTGADVIKATAKIGQMLGVTIDQNTVANSEAYKSAQTKIWQNLVSQMGGNRGVTKEEADEIKQIIPRINDSPEGRARIIQILRNSHARAVQDYAAMASAAERSYKHKDPTIFHQELTKLYTGDGTPQQAVPMTNTSGAGGTKASIPGADWLRQNGL